MPTTAISRPYRRRYRKRKGKKRIIHQSLRVKFDKGLVVTFPQTSGEVIFDLGNTDVYTVHDILDTSIMKPFSNYWAYYQIYGVGIEATPTKNVLNNYPSVYIGFLYNANNEAPSIDTTRALENTFCLPAFGSDVVKKFWYINAPWLPRPDPPIGYFFVQCNENSTLAQGPRWEVRLSVYVRFRLLQV